MFYSHFYQLLGWSGEFQAYLTCMQMPSKLGELAMKLTWVRLLGGAACRDSAEGNHISCIRASLLNKPVNQLKRRTAWHNSVTFFGRLFASTHSRCGCRHLANIRGSITVAVTLARTWASRWSVLVWDEGSVTCLGQPWQPLGTGRTCQSCSEAQEGHSREVGGRPGWCYKEVLRGESCCPLSIVYSCPWCWRWSECVEHQQGCTKLLCQAISGICVRPVPGEKLKKKIQNIKQPKKAVCGGKRAPLSW